MFVPPSHPPGHNQRDVGGDSVPLWVVYHRPESVIAMKIRGLWDKSPRPREGVGVRASPVRKSCDALGSNPILSSKSNMAHTLSVIPERIQVWR